MSYTADSIRDLIRIRIVTPDSIRIRFERKRPIRRSLLFTENSSEGAHQSVNLSLTIAFASSCRRYQDVKRKYVSCFKALLSQLTALIK